MKQTKSVRLENYQCVELEGLKTYLVQSNFRDMSDSAIFRAMLNFAIKNKEATKSIIQRNGFIKVEELIAENM